MMWVTYGVHDGYDVWRTRRIDGKRGSDNEIIEVVRTQRQAGARSVVVNETIIGRAVESPIAADSGTKQRFSRSRQPFDGMGRLFPRQKYQQDNAGKCRHINGFHCKPLSNRFGVNFQSTVPVWEPLLPTIVH